MGEETADGGTIKFGANVDIGYYDQHQAGLHPDKDVLNELWDDFPRLDADRVRGVLALFLFTGDDVFQKIHTLSGGERGRLALAKLMLRKDNLLFMDEPTNHLDMDSREVLEHALDDFDGTLLAVSHDRYFINRVANRVIEMSAEGVSEYLGNYDDYLEKKRAALLPEEAVSDGLTQTQRDKLKRKERLARESRRQLEDRVRAAEAEIARTEAEVAHLEAEMAAPGAWQDPEAGRALTESHARAKETLDALYDEWAELAELLEEKA